MRVVWGTGVFLWVRFMASPHEEHHEQEKQAGIQGEDDAPNDKLLEMMVGFSIYNQQSVVALPWLWEEEGAAAADRFSPAFLGPHRAIIDPRAYAPAPLIGQEAGPSTPSQMHLASARMPLLHCDRSVPDAHPFVEGRLLRSIARGPRNELVMGMPPPGTIAAARGGDAHPGGHAYMAPPPYLHGGTVAINRPNLCFPRNEEALLLALSKETPESIVSYACDLLESRHGQRLFRLIFNHCGQQLRDQIVATITRDRKSFGNLCTQRYLIKYRTCFLSVLLLALFNMFFIQQ